MLQPCAYRLLTKHAVIALPEGGPGDQGETPFQAEIAPLIVVRGIFTLSSVFCTILTLP